MFEKTIDKNDSSETILSVERTLLILRRLAETKGAIGVRDMSRELGYSPAVTQKILNTLRVHGYVITNEDTHWYSLGPAALQLGMAMLSQLNVVRIARPFMESLTEKTGETTFLAIREGLRAIYIDKEVSSNQVRMDAEVGGSRPLNCTAVGKIFLAFDDRKLINEAAAAGAFVKSTPNSIIDKVEIEQEITRTLQNGYAVDYREFHLEAICVAAPIFGSNRKPIAALTTSGLASRMEGNIDKIAELVKDIANQISNSMGYNAN